MGRPLLTRTLRRTCSGALVAGLLAAGTARAEPEDEMRALLDQGQPAAAYALARAHAERQGQPAYDFFFGIIAIAAGHAAEGVLALERYLRDYPDNRSARFQLARGYYALGADQRARAEFERLEARAEGEEALAIDRFLDALRARAERHQPSGSVFLEMGIGFDSNINAGPTGGAAAGKAGLGSLTILSGNGVPAPARDSFSLLGGEASGSYPLAPGIALNGSLAFDARFHRRADNDVFDQANVIAVGGVDIVAGQDLFKLGAGMAQLSLDNQHYLQTPGLNAEWSRQLNRQHRVDLFGQLARFNYDDIYVFPLSDKSLPRQLVRNSVRSADFAGLSGGWSATLGGEFLPLLRVTGDYGRERNREDRPDLSRDLLGIRAVLSIAPALHWGASVGLGYQTARHREPNLFAGATERRRDTLRTLEAGATYQLDRQVSLRADYTRQTQRSNNTLYRYERDLLFFKIRYDFD